MTCARRFGFPEYLGELGVGIRDGCGSHYDDDRVGQRGWKVFAKVSAGHEEKSLVKMLDDRRCWHLWRIMKTKKQILVILA